MPSLFTSDGPATVGRRRCGSSLSTTLGRIPSPPCHYLSTIFLLKLLALTSSYRSTSLMLPASGRSISPAALPSRHRLQARRRYPATRLRSLPQRRVG